MTPPCNAAGERPLCQESIGTWRVAKDPKEVRRKGDNLGAIPAHLVTPLARSLIFSSAFAINSTNCSGGGAVLESKHPASRKGTSI